MNKTLKLFSLVFLFIFSAVFADSKADLEKYRLYVTMVDPEFHCFALSNHMVLNIPKRNWETAELPAVGAEIYIQPYSRRISHLHSSEVGNFAITFSNNPDMKLMLVWMPKASEEYCLTYLSSELICSVPRALFLSPEYRYVMTLSDGSRWIMKRDGESKFSPGERVIVGRDERDEFCIISIDQSVIRKHVYFRNDAYIGQVWEEVKPYIPEETFKE